MEKVLPLILDQIDDFYKTPLLEEQTIEKDGEEYKILRDGSFNPLSKVIEIYESGNKDGEMALLEEDCDKMDKAMQVIVKEYFEGFNRSIVSYRHILKHIEESKRNVKQLKSHTQRAKGDMSMKSGPLRPLWLDLTYYNHMLAVISSVEELQRTPEQLEAYLAGKHYLHAAVFLQKSLKLARSEDLKDIQALYNVRETLREHDAEIYKEVIAEMQHMIYQDSPFKTSPATCNDAPSALDEHRRQLVLEALPTFVSSRESGPTKSKRAGRRAGAGFMDDVVVEHLSHPGRWNGKMYMRRLVEVVCYLKREPEALVAVTSRLPPLLQAAMLEATNAALEKAEQNHQLPRGQRATLQRSISTMAMSSGTEGQVLLAVLKAVFERCKPILRAHEYLTRLYRLTRERSRTVNLSFGEFYVNASGFSIRTDSKDTNEDYTVEYVWDVMQQEVTSLLSAYLQPNGDAASVPTVPEREKLSHSGLTIATLSSYFSPRSSSSGEMTTSASEAAPSQRLFRFTHSAATFDGGERGDVEEDKAGSDLVPSSPANIAVMFQPLCRFVEECLVVMGRPVDDDSIFNSKLIVWAEERSAKHLLHSPSNKPLPASRIRGYTIALTRPDV